MKTSEFTLKEIFLDLLCQACGTKFNKVKGWMEFDSLCISSYENALEYAVAQGWLDEDQVIR